MSGDQDKSYRDPTRIIHMLQALERLEEESRDVTRDDLFFEDRLTRAIVFDLDFTRFLRGGFHETPDFIG